MTSRKLAIPIVMIFSLVLFAACGGGGGGGSSDTQPGPPLDISDVSRGEIDHFGSIFMNGKEYETGEDFTDVQGDDNPSLSDLQEGMEVEIYGGFDDNGNLTAGVIRVEEALKGPVDVAYDAAAMSFGAMGQTVSVDATTVVDNNGVLNGTLASLGNLDAGTDNVEVHGDVLPGGIILASFIEQKFPPFTHKVRGFVSNLGANSFELANLTVNFTLAIVDDDLELANDVLVEVKSASPPTGGAITASSIEGDELELGNVVEGAEIEVEGFVTGKAGNQFMVGGATFILTSSTEFLGGLEMDLVDGAFVEAEGHTSATGPIPADKVKFKGTVELAGNIASFDPLTIEGLGGIEVEINPALTDLEEDIQPTLGNHVKIRGRILTETASTVTVLALRVEAEDQPDDDVVLQGMVDTVDMPGGGAEGLTILGIVVDTSSFDEAAGAEDSDFQSEGDTDLTRAQFYDLVGVGSIVKAKARIDDPDFWREVELEGEDD